jgi:hypothetical protein
MTTPAPAAEVELYAGLPVPAQPGTAAPDAMREYVSEHLVDLAAEVLTRQFRPLLAEAMENPGDLLEDLIAAAAERADQRREYHEQPVQGTARRG